MRYLFVVSLLLASCVSADTAVGYAKRAHPDCSDFKYLAHSYNSGSKETRGSQTEVQMTCSGVTKSVTVKCIHGFDVISDTTCHENN